METETDRGNSGYKKRRSCEAAARNVARKEATFSWKKESAEAEVQVVDINLHKDTHHIKVE